MAGRKAAGNRDNAQAVARAAAFAVLVVAVVGARNAARAPAEWRESRLPAMRAGDRARLEALGARMLPPRGAGLQATTFDCGVAVVREAVRTVTGAAPPRDSIARLAGMTTAGTRIDGLARALDAFDVRADRADGALGAHRVAAYIAHLRAGHFVLVREVAGDSVAMFDPLAGEVRIGLREFRSLWSGAGLDVDRGQGGGDRQPGAFE